MAQTAGQSKASVQRSDAVDQWCLWLILNIYWHDSVRNVMSAV